MPKRTLTEKQKAARRGRAKLRREAAKKEAKAKKPEPKAKPKRTAKLKQARARREKVEEGKKRLRKKVANAVVWKCEMEAEESGMEYGPMWINGRLMGKKRKAWVPKDVARDIATTLGLRFKEV